MGKIRVPKFEIWHSPTSGDWWWCLVATNGRIIATSGEGYKRRGHVIAMVQKIGHQASVAGMHEVNEVKLP